MLVGLTLLAGDKTCGEGFAKLWSSHWNVRVLGISCFLLWASAIIPGHYSSYELTNKHKQVYFEHPFHALDYRMKMEKRHMVGYERPE